MPKTPCRCERELHRGAKVPLRASGQEKRDRPVVIRARRLHRKLATQRERGALFEERDALEPALDRDLNARGGQRIHEDLRLRSNAPRHAHRRLTPARGFLAPMREGKLA